MNPVRAGIVVDPKEYRWSSYNVYAYGKRDTLIDEHPIYQHLGQDEHDRRHEYRDFVKGMIKEKEAMRGEMSRRLVYGSDEFVMQLKKRYKLNAVIKQRGRPKKDDGNNK